MRVSLAVCDAVPSPAEAISTPHPTPTAAPHDTQESPPLAREFHSAAVWGPEARLAMLRSGGGGRMTQPSRGRWLQSGHREPGSLHTQFTSGSLIRSHPRGQRCVLSALRTEGPWSWARGDADLASGSAWGFSSSVWFWGNFSIFRTENV